MEKALLCADPARCASLLASVSASARDVQQCLAFLPADPQVMVPVLSFVNQLHGYASSLVPELVRHGRLPQGADDRLTRQLALCAQLSDQLSLARDPADLSALILEGVLPQPDKAVRALGLPEGEITQEEAIGIARSVVGPRTISVSAAPGTSGALPAYGVSVQTDDVLLNLEITRQGGKVLWMMPETASFPVLQSVQTCVAAAGDFLNLQHFGPVKDVYWQSYDGLCVITFVPLQEGVLLYPDLIRVQVRMDTAQVVGLEAHQYWLNHTGREISPPGLSAQEAAERIAAHARTDNVQLCVIPSDAGERLCYECRLIFNEETYLVYLDAQDGSEVQLLKLIPLENGSLTA